MSQEQPSPDDMSIRERTERFVGLVDDPDRLIESAQVQPRSEHSLGVIRVPSDALSEGVLETPRGSFLDVHAMAYRRSGTYFDIAPPASIDDSIVVVTIYAAEPLPTEQKPADILRAFSSPDAVDAVLDDITLAES